MRGVLEPPFFVIAMTIGCRPNKDFPTDKRELIEHVPESKRQMHEVMEFLADALSPLPFNLPLVFAITEMKESLLLPAPVVVYLALF
jgi:hypothetical protein